jgi:RND family efflux transporter MFP subunit
MRFARYIALAFFLLFVGALSLAQENTSQDKPQGPPPAVVVTAKATSGMVHPQNEFVGTVFYPEVSRVASEVSGRVERINFEEGQEVEKGQVLVTLSKDLMQKDLDSAESAYEKVLADLEKARIDLRRFDALFDAKSASEREYDEARFKALSLEREARSLEAEAERLRLEIEKTQVRAPYHGVILEREADRGEWLSPGSPVASMARNDYVEVVVDVPEEVLQFMKPGMSVEVTASGKNYDGKVFAVIPRGDIATRTFPVKMKLQGSPSLAQGMEARVRLPSGPEIKTVLVPRDAVLQSFGNFVVWVVNEGMAQPVPVQVAAYVGLNAAVRGQGLQEGSEVVIKGNERLTPGQAVMAAH